MNKNNRNIGLYETAALYFFVFAVIIFTMFTRFFYAGDGYISAFDDDFYYYLKIAQNIAIRGISSFDGTHISNGYHPLWMLIIVSAVKIAGSGILFFIIMSLIISIINFFIFSYSLKICGYFFYNKRACYLLSLTALIFSLQLTRSGMEVSLTILMMTAIINFIIQNNNRVYEPKIIINLGFLSSIMVLSRLDSALFVIIFLIGFIDIKNPALFFKRFILFGLGGVLVPLYLIFNYSFFDTFMPVSGQAKHLKSGLMPSINAFSSLISIRPQRLFIIPALAVSFIALAIIPFNKKAGSIIRNLIFYPVIIFGFIHIGILSVVSDWRVWGWYAYPYVSSLTVSSIIVLIFLKDKKFFLKFLIAHKNKLTLILLVFVCLYGIISTARFIQYVPAKNSIYQASAAIREFEKDNPGVYAMGDRAGTVGFMIRSPLIQLEGLVMDKKFLENIKSSRNLIDTLKDYKVDYYIATNPKRENVRFEFAEPNQALGNSPKMRGFLSQNPVLEFTANGVKTAIFKIEKN